MKKLLMTGTALVGAAILATPAKADLKLDLGGHFRGYALYSDQDETGTAGDSDDLRNFDFRRDFEVHFSGETTTDQGLTVGVHAELDLGGSSSYYDGLNTHLVASPWANNFSSGTTMLDEAYIYFSGGWGRVNFGSEDGAAYLLQVAAPSADSNVDGLRVYVQGLNMDAWDDGVINNSFGPTVGSSWSGYSYALGYDNAFFRNTDRITYLTPKWNGFQAGVSFAPEQGQNAIDNAWGAMNTDDDEIDYENLWDAAARWDGEFNGFGISVGAGYTHASAENGAAAGADNFGSDDISAWDAGINVAYMGWSLGVGYLDYTDTGVNDAGANGTDVTTWIVGGAWDNGPWHVGASWYNTELEQNAFGFQFTNGLGLEIDRWTLGGGYTYGPGMTFRGAVAWGEVDTGVAADDTDFVQVTFGTDVSF
jgi:outer membrane protein OmpU